MFRKAQRSAAKLRLGLAGVSGAGKTYSALLVASGIAPWDKIALIDTENGSGDLYAQLGPYSICQVQAPYTVDKYLEAIREAEDAGFEVIIIDSLSHAWAGEGGLLDQHDNATSSAKHRGNSYTAWREITPKHNQLVEAILKSPVHIIATTRSKQAYEQTEENGKKKVVKLGLAPIQRDGMEYEFTSFLDISLEHVASSSKDRTGIFDGKYVKLSADTGKQLLKWLNAETVADPPKEEKTPEKEATSPAKVDWSPIQDMLKRAGYDRTLAGTLWKQTFPDKKMSDATDKDISQLLDVLLVYIDEHQKQPEEQTA